MLAAGSCTAAVGTAIGVSVSVTFVVSFSMGVLVTSILGYISSRSKESSHKPSKLILLLCILRWAQIRSR